MQVTQPMDPDAARRSGSVDETSSSWSLGLLTRRPGRIRPPSHEWILRGKNARTRTQQEAVTVPTPLESVFLFFQEHRWPPEEELIQ